MNVIEARNLVRYYGGARGVAGLDLDVPEGSVMGLLGLNGSGKTTAIKLALGLLVPNSGTATLWGQDSVELPAALRARIAYVADEVDLPGWMTLKEGMNLYASYYPKWDSAYANSLIERFGLSMAKRYAALSKGQKRRFFLCLALAQQPDLIVLDETAGGLDPVIRREFLDVLIEARSERDVTILFSSHILSDVERIVDRVAFVSDGRCLLQGDLDELKGEVKRLCIPESADSSLIRQRFTVVSENVIGGTRQLHVAGFHPSRLVGIDCEIEHLNLEDIFLAYHANTKRAEVQV